MGFRVATGRTRSVSDSTAPSFPLVPGLPAALLFLCLFAFSSSDALATVTVPSGFSQIELRPDVEVLEDTTGKLGFDEIARLPSGVGFSRRTGEGDLNFGFSRSVFWLRLSFRADGVHPLPALLEIAYPALDHVDFYARVGLESVHYQAGDNLKFSVRPYFHRNLVFPVSIPADTGQTVYLRIATNGSLTVPIKLWSEAGLHQADQSLYSIHALYFGMLLALGLYNLLIYFSLRDDVYLAYVGYLCALATAQLGMLGLGHQFLWPDLPWLADKAVLLGFSLAGVFGALCARGFLDTPAWAPRFNRLVTATCMLFLLGTSGVLFEEIRPFAMLVAVMAPFAAAILTVGGVLALRAGRPGALMFLAAFAAFILGMIAAGLRSLGWIPSNPLTSYSLQIGSGVEMLLLSFALAERIRNLRRTTEEALGHREDALFALTEAERQLEQRIADRTSELANANERLLHSQEELSHLALFDPLTGLSNRTRLREQLLMSMARSRRSGGVCALLMIDLDGFKAANDTHGHAVGDQLLTQVAKRLLATVRSTDTVARVGGDEFLIVLEAAGSMALAEIFADKLIGKLTQPFEVGNRAISIGASVGIAMYPAHAEEIDTLLQLADHAMYEAKRAGKGRWVSARAGACVLEPASS